MEEEEIKRIAELREMLEGRVKNLEAELEGLQALLDLINDLLVEKSFKRAEEIAKPALPVPVETKPGPPPEKLARTVPLKTGAGVLLANVYVEDDHMRIVPAPDMRFDVNTPPFTAFLIDRMFAKMQDKDKELVRQGILTADKAFSYEVKKAGDTLQEIRIENFAPQRERELRSATRWTLEKMYEKTRGSA